MLSQISNGVVCIKKDVIIDFGDAMKSVFARGRPHRQRQRRRRQFHGTRRKLKTRQRLRRRIVESVDEIQLKYVAESSSLFGEHRVEILVWILCDFLVSTSVDFKLVERFERGLFVGGAEPHRKSQWAIPKP